jgi:hypothetical protein
MRANNARTLNAGVSYPDFLDWRAEAKGFEGIGAMRETTMNVGDEQFAPERFIGSYISANAFGLVKQQPVLGRDFSPGDDRPGAAPVVILSHSLVAHHAERGVAAWTRASIGMIAAAGIGRLLASVLIGTRNTDPLILFAVAALLAAVCLSACFFPARRAMRLDPATVLRSE